MCVCVFFLILFAASRNAVSLACMDLYLPHCAVKKPGFATC